MSTAGDMEILHTGETKVPNTCGTCNNGTVIKLMYLVTVCY